MARLNLKMPYGEVAVDFTDNEDLKKQLEKIDFEGLVRIISDKVGSILTESKKIREDLKDICETDGRYIIFKKVPSKKIDKVILAIYAYGNSATVEEIKRTTGISDPSGDYLNSGSYSKYFVSYGNKSYGLSDVGLHVAVDEILPKLRSVAKGGTGKNQN